jgi:hypothetical protein
MMPITRRRSAKTRRGRCLAASGLALVLGLAACRASEPGRTHLLVTIPGAADVAVTGSLTSYTVADPYPAASTLRALHDRLAALECSPMDRDPFNAEPVLPLNQWTEYEDEDGGPSRLLWIGAWTCRPDGTVVTFAVTTTRTRDRQPAAGVQVKGAAYSADAVRAARALVAPVGLADRLHAGPTTELPGRVSLQTCAVCGSTRKQVDERPWKVLYQALAAAHDHRWEDGVSSGVPIADGRVVLVRRQLRLDEPAFAYGAFILENQFLRERESMGYRWLLRTDGGSVLDPADARVSQGSAADRSRIAFGPFRIPWSAAGAGNGFVYYPRSPGAARSSLDWEMCLTDLTSFARLDAADPRFVYRTSPVD